MIPDSLPYPVLAVEGGGGDQGATPMGSASQASPEAAPHLRPAGVDPSRDAADLDARLKAAGMYSVTEMMGVTPLTRWEVHSGMTDFDFFGQWLDQKSSEYLRMKARYELGERDKDDELYEWVLAHSAVFSVVRSNFRAAAQGIEAEGRNTEGGSVHESPVDKVDAPPSLPPTGEGLPEEIVKAISRFAEASRHEGGAVEGATEEGLAQAERNANSAYLALDATILHHLTEKQERSRLEAEGWGQASVVSCYWIQSKPDHELVPVVNLDLRKLYEATHELTHETALSAARARAERAEAALDQVRRDAGWFFVGFRTRQAVETALSSVAEEA